MDKFKEIFEAIKADPQNKKYTKDGIEPLYSVHKEAKICIIGQAPGIRAQESRLFWNDPSGDRLRDLGGGEGLELTEPLFMSQIKYLFCL